MNFIGIFILLALLGEYVLSLISDVLNLSRLQKQIPEPFKDVYNEQQYRKSQDYLHVNTRFGWISSTFDLGLLLIFWFVGGFPILDSWVRSFDKGPVFSGLLFLGVLVVFKYFISIPFGIYHTFVIEQRFGFNKTTLGTFVMDNIKGLLLSVLLGVPLICAILWFFEYAGNMAWLYCWVAVTVYSLFIHYVAPNWIMPLFNKFETLGDSDLKEAILDYARSIKFPLENVYVMDGSKRSIKSNAFFTGFGKNRRIVLFDTLIDRHTTEELVAVLAHEMGHYQKKHILKGMIMGIVQAGIMFYLLSLLISYEGLFHAFYVENISVYGGLVFFGILYTPVAFFSGLITLWISRKNEYDADQFAVKTTGFSKPMIEALKKLSVNNFSNLVPHPFYVFLNYSHPPVLERIRAIESPN